MTRPLLEVADIVRAQGDRFIQNNFRWIHWAHRKVLRAIARCRTAALGGHRDQCPRCGYRTTSYNSCRDRHCPKCQSGARDKWIRARQSELLPVPYVHVVFTLPHQLSPLALQNKKVLYDLLFRASAETLQEVARDPRHLGADIGFLSVLHTWGQNLLAHPHLHCVIPAGGLSPDGTQWIHPRYPFFLPVHVLSRVFRGKFVAGLKRRFQQHQLTFAGTLQPLANEKAFRSFLRPLFRLHQLPICSRSPSYTMSLMLDTIRFPERRQNERSRQAASYSAVNVVVFVFRTGCSGAERRQRTKTN
jgi:predicted Zn-ribbon and HTH transcriptional regulator